MELLHCPAKSLTGSRTFEYVDTRKFLQGPNKDEPQLFSKRNYSNRADNLQLYHNSCQQSHFSLVPAYIQVRCYILLPLQLEELVCLQACGEQVHEAHHKQHRLDSVVVRVGLHKQRVLVQYKLRCEMKKKRFAWVCRWQAVDGNVAAILKLYGHHVNTRDTEAEKARIMLKF